MIRPVLFTFIFIFVLFFIIYYYSIEEYRRGDTLPATTPPATPTLVFRPCKGVYNWWITGNGTADVFQSPSPYRDSDTPFRCNAVTCSSTINGRFQSMETDPSVLCSYPDNKTITIVCPRCQNLSVGSCQFTPNNTANSQIVTNDIQAQPIVASTDPSYSVDTGTVSAYQTAYNRYMNLIKNCNSPPPFDTTSNSFVCPSTSPVATVNSDNMVVCSS
jgi:hypothetical protein